MRLKELSYQHHKSPRLYKPSFAFVPLLFLFSLTPSAHAESQQEANDKAYNAGTTEHTQNSNQQSSGTVSDLSQVQNGRDINSGANSAGLKMAIGAAGNAAIGTFLSPICIDGVRDMPFATSWVSAACPHFPACPTATARLTADIAKTAACPLASMALQQAMSLGNQAKSSFGTSTLTQCQGSYCTGGYNPDLNSNQNGYNPEGPDGNGGGRPQNVVPGMIGLDSRTQGGSKNANNGGPFGNSGGLPPEVQTLISQAQKSIKSLEGAGLKYDAKTDTYTLPDGKTVKGSSLGSSSAMAAAGYSPEQIAAIQKIMNDANKTGERKVSELESLLKKYGSLGLGGDSPNSPEALSFSQKNASQFGGGYRNLASLEAAGRDVAGLQKQLDGQPIGVSGDDIFRMITRKYGSLQQEGRVSPVP